MHVPRALVGAAVTVAMTLGACGGGEERTSAPILDASSTATSEEETSTPAEVASTAASTLPAGDHSTASPPSPPAPPPFSADTRPDTGQAEGTAPTSVAAVDIALHDEGFDRIVFRIAGAGLAGWDVRYVTSARSQGSGDPLEVAGSASLEVTLTNMGYPHDVAGPSYAGPRRIRPPDTRAIREIVDDNVYEGRHVFFVGTAGKLPFRVFRLDGPQRVVVDVQHAR